MNNTEWQNSPNNMDEENIDLLAIFKRVLSYWYLFLAGITIALALGFLYNRYTPNTYQVSASMLVKQDKMGIDPTAMVTGMKFKSNNNIDNEIGILKSYSLKERTIRELDFLNVSYYRKGRFATKELYTSTPFNVEIDYDTTQATGINYRIEFIDQESYYLISQKGSCKFYDYNTDTYLGASCEVVELKNVYKFGEWVSNGYNTFRIVLNNNYTPQMSGKENSNIKYSFIINSRISLIKQMSNLTISTSTKSSSILNLTIQGYNPQKITDYLNQLLSIHTKRNLEEKNLVSENTILFIDQQLVGIEEALNQAEVDLQKFQEGNEFMDLNTQSKQMFSELKSIEKHKGELELNVKYYENLREYVRKNIDDMSNLVVPSAMGIQDPVLNKLVTELVALSTEKSKTLTTSTEKNPIVQNYDELMIQTKRQLLENIENMINNANLTIEELSRSISVYEKQINRLPTTQRMYLGHQRKFALNDDLYKFLMQRRAEAQIVMASNSPDNSVIDPARVSAASIVAPNRNMIYLVCIVLGCAIPALYIFLKEIFNTKILEKGDIEKVTKFPIIGQIPYIDPKDSTPTFVIDSPKSPISESFRSIRTNIEYIVKGKEKCVFSVISDSIGIGKTYISINMASIYAMYGKKTVLVGMDLRKPRIYQEFGLSNKKGVSSYLSGKATIHDVIQPSGKLSNLDIITGGPIPPNPAELMASDKCTEFFNELKEIYDYIIIDTPPLLWVTDALLIMKHVDTSIYVVRQNVSNKKAFETVIKDLEERKDSVSIVANGINYQGLFGYRYSQEYGVYGYGGKYGKASYYDEEHIENK